MFLSSAFGPFVTEKSEGARPSGRGAYLKAAKYGISSADSRIADAESPRHGLQMDEHGRFQLSGCGDKVERLREEAKRCRERAVYPFSESARKMLRDLAERHESQAARLEGLAAVSKRN
jgi:hypothetical protein